MRTPPSVPDCLSEKLATMKRGPYKQYLRDPNRAIPRQNSRTGICTNTSDAESSGEAETSHSPDSPGCESQFVRPALKERTPPISPPRSIGSQISGKCMVHTVLLHNITCMYYTYMKIRYQKVQKRNSCVVELLSGEYGELQFFIAATPSYCAIAVLQILHTQPSPFQCSRLRDIILQVERSTTLVARSVKSIVRKCVLVEIQDKLYVCRIPNLYESD